MTLRVCVVYSPAPREVREWQVSLPEGATVRDAVLASGMASEFPQGMAGAAAVGVWGRQATLAQPLRDQDRVEVYRPLAVDPKVARRERFRKQGARGAGLFARRRAGGKPGY